MFGLISREQIQCLLKVTFTVLSCYFRPWEHYLANLYARNSTNEAEAQISDMLEMAGVCQRSPVVITRPACLCVLLFVCCFFYGCMHVLTEDRLSHLRHRLCMTSVRHLCSSCLNKYICFIQIEISMCCFYCVPGYLVEMAGAESNFYLFFPIYAAKPSSLHPSH